MTKKRHTPHRFFSYSLPQLTCFAHLLLTCLYLLFLMSVFMNFKFSDPTLSFYFLKYLPFPAFPLHFLFDIMILIFPSRHPQRPVFSLFPLGSADQFSSSFCQYYFFSIPSSLLPSSQFSQVITICSFLCILPDLCTTNYFYNWKYIKIYILKDRFLGSI